MADIPSSDASVNEAEAALWVRWRDLGDMTAREQLVLHYLPFARVLAALRYKARIHSDVDFEDYLQLARLGLVESVDRYDPGRGAQFKTFAAHRIRGAILSGLETATEQSQQVIARKHLRAERLQQIKSEALAKVEQEVLRVQKTTESTETNVQKNALLAYLAEVGIGVALGIMLEGTGMIGTKEEVQNSESVAQNLTPEVLYFRKTEIQHWQQLLRDALAKLPKQESRVIRYHYQQGVPFEEIAAMQGLSRSRISQLHRQGLLGLRQMLGQGPPADIFF